MSATWSWVVVMMLLLTTQGAYAMDKEIKWIGHPMVSDNDKFTPSNGWLPGYQIGLREDGVVVWREVDLKGS